MPAFWHKYLGIYENDDPSWYQPPKLLAGLEKTREPWQGYKDAQREKRWGWLLRIVRWIFLRHVVERD